VNKPEYDDTPAGKAKYWADEFEFARKANKKFEKDGKRIVKRYLDERTGDNDLIVESRLNIFYSNITTLQAMLYGNTPKVEVMRTFQDPKDDVARVAALMSQRILNQDIQDPADDFKVVLRSSLEDRLLPGLGAARVRYQFRSEPFEQKEVKDVQGNIVIPAAKGEKVVDEWVETVYTHWQDYLYSPARTAGEVRWKAYRSFLNYDEAEKRWGEDVAKKLPPAKQGPVKTNKGNQGQEQCVPQVAVWEVWDKTHLKICWYVEEYPEILEESEDFLMLDNFFPEPPPMMANTTTTKYTPRGDYMLAKDLYEEIDNLQTRISILTEACKLVGVYDKQNEGVKRIFQEGFENQLIPVDNWAMFAEKGGLDGVISWVPLEDVVNTISVLTEKQGQKIQQLYEITGLSDILRGASQPYEAASTSKSKVQFASLRVQRIQLEFAEFASNLQALKLEIMQKHFQPETLITQSNILSTPDAGLASAAVQLLQNPDAARWKIMVRPESLALADYAQLKQDRLEFIEGLSMFLQSSQGLAQLDKKIVPTLMELLQWGLAGFRGSNEIEGVLDRAIETFQKQADAPPEKSPEEKAMEQTMQLEREAHQNKMQVEAAQMEQDRLKAEAERQQSAAEFDAKLILDQQKFEQEMQQDREKHQMEMEQLREKNRLELEKIRAGVEAQTIKTELSMEAASHAAQVSVRSEDEGDVRGNGSA
jgi:hypothetical protein